MDPLWASIAEFWWIGPAAAGSGVVGVLGVRRGRTASARRLEYDAARHDLRRARSEASGARVATKIARAELGRAKAQRAAARAPASAVIAARQALQRSQRDARVAAADVRARRAQVTAARVAVPRGSADPSTLPLGRLIAAHDAVTAQWMAYETDPGLQIAFPMMSDAREPLTAAFLEAQRAAQWLRPASARARISPAEFAAYRDAVGRASAAFEVAEADAYRRARASGAVPAEPNAPADPWSTLTRTLAETVIASSTDAVKRVAETMAARAARESPSAEPAGAKPPQPEPVWPVPSRDRPSARRRE